MFKSISKQRGILLGVLLLSVATLSALDLGFAWKPSPSVGVEKYNLYERVSQDGTNWTAWTKTNSVPANQLSCRQTNVGVGFHQWYATAANSQDESGPSETVSYRVWPNPQAPVFVSVTVLVGTNTLQIITNFPNAFP